MRRVSDRYTASFGLLDFKMFKPLLLLTRCLFSLSFLGTSFNSLSAQENAAEADFQEMCGPSVFMHKNYLNKGDKGHWEC